MPLHLLGKKSWNVYSPANIERVKRDEAAAAAAAEALDQRMQEEDNERRMRILRGLPVDDLPPQPNPDQIEPSEISAPNSTKSLHTHDESRIPGRERKRRRIAGENETEREIRYVLEDRAVEQERAEKSILGKQKKSVDGRVNEVPLVGRDGHVNLFPAAAREEKKREREGQRQQRNPEKEAEEKRRNREAEAKVCLKFENAAGVKGSVGDRPWYLDRKAGGAEVEGQGDGDGLFEAGKNVWGNEDPKRGERDMRRLVGNDPLAMIHRGVQGVRKVEKERKEWKDKRMKELEEPVRAEKRHKKRREERIRDDEDELEGFSLDAGAEASREQDEERHKHRHHRHHRHKYHNRYKDSHGHRERRRDRSRHRRRSRSPRIEDAVLRDMGKLRAIRA